MMARRLYVMVVLGIFAGSGGAQTVTGVQTIGNTVRCMLSNGSAVDVSPATDCMVRVEYRQNNAASGVSELMDSSYGSALQFTGTNLDGNPVLLTGPNYSVSITKTPAFGIVFKNSQGTTLFSSTAISQFAVNGTVIAGNYYGVHNQTYGYNAGGLTISGNLNIYDPAQVQQGGATSPFAWTSKGFGILIDAEVGTFNFVNSTTLNMSRTTGQCANANCLFWLMAGTPRQIMAGYYKASGSFPVPPKWVCGFMNSEWGIMEQEFKTIVSTYRTKNIPIDVFILDYDWFDYNITNDGDFKWRTSFFPNVSTGLKPWPVGGAFKQWADSQGVKLVGIRKPHGIWTGSEVWGNCGDFYSQAIRTSYWEKLVDPAWDSRARGIIAYWNDEADQCINGDKPFMFLYMQKSLYCGQRYNARPGWPTYHNERVWSINRAYYGGAQKYAYALWSGDIGCTNQSMQDNRKFMLTSVNLGAAWWSQDIGGFQTDPTAQEYQHWMQFGAFTPIFRVHGNCGKQRQPWIFTNGYGGQPADGGIAERVSTNVIRLRYTFVPYIYSAYWKLHRDGIPLVRPLVMDYPADNNVAEHVDSWMFCDDILVSPVVTNYTAKTKQVYLPAGNWYDFWTDAMYQGGAKVNIPVTGMGDTFPVLVRQGAIVPRQPVIPYLNNYPITQNANYAVVPVTFHVYGGADGVYEYTDDDGVTYNYEKGEYRVVPYFHKTGVKSERVIVGARQGTYSPADSNGYFVFHGIDWTPRFATVQSGDISQSKVAVAALSGTPAPAWAWDSIAKTALVKVVSPFTAGNIYVGEQQIGVIHKGGNHYRISKTRVVALKGRITVAATLTGGSDLAVRVVSAAGATVLERRFRGISAGEHTFSIPAEFLPRGLYFVLLSSGDCKIVKKIMAVL